MQIKYIYVYTYNPSTQEAETEELLTFEAKLSYEAKPCLRTERSQREITRTASCSSVCYSLPASTYTDQYSLTYLAPV